MNEAHRIGGARPQPALVVMGAKLRLVGGNIDVHRAIALATLAAEAEIERLLDFPAAPAVADRSAVQHLEQKPRATARRIHLLAGRHVTRAHDARGAVAPAAGAD